MASISEKFQSMIPGVTAPARARARKRALQDMSMRGVRTSPVSVTSGSAFGDIDASLGGKEMELGMQGLRFGEGLAEAERGREYGRERQEAGFDFQREMYEKQKKAQQDQFLQTLLGSLGGTMLAPLATGASAGLAGMLFPSLKKGTKVGDIDIPGLTAGSAVRGQFGLMTPTQAAMMQQLGGGGNDQMMQWFMKMFSGGGGFNPEEVK